MARRITTHAELQALAARRPPRIAVILGSGLSDLADQLEDAVELPFLAIPGMDAPSVAGHRGVLLLGRWAGTQALVFAGRLHGYEGHAWRSALEPIHVAHQLGASILLATNAAGGIRDDLSPGTLMAIHGHLDCTRAGWWHELMSPKEAASAKPQASIYSARLLDLLPLPRGIYAEMLGPCYETPAEIRALRSCGADAVGMSTAREIDAAHRLGMECAAISCITNRAAGLSSGPISHEEVLATGRAARDRLIAVLEAFVAKVSD